MGRLSFPLLVIAAALLGLGQPVASTARLLLVRAVVPGQQLTRALTQDEIRINGAALAGLPLAGPFVFVAGSFIVSAASALLVRVRPAPPGDGAASLGQAPRGAVAGRPGLGTGMLAGYACCSAIRCCAPSRC
jgi:hypothetical protein